MLLCFCEFELLSFFESYVFFDLTPLPGFNVCGGVRWGECGCGYWVPVSVSAYKGFASSCIGNKFKKRSSV